MTIAFRNQYMTIKEAAVLLGVHEVTIRKWIWAKKLPAFPIGKGSGTIRISRIDLELIIETAKEMYEKKIDEKIKQQEAKKLNRRSQPPLPAKTDPQ